MSHTRIRSFNKHILNRITRTFARFSRGPFAVIRHVGRHSGKPYETPIIVEPTPTGDGVVIALTYGPEVDWYRNVLAAGHCTLLWNGSVYALEKSEPMAVQTALPAFPQPFRLILRMLGTQHFVSMQYQAAVRASETARA
ncbi:MAG: nitroreductase family deazaflavin-dependent oxidoreductase [Ktedonobacteraceae bacterium]